MKERELEEKMRKISKVISGIGKNKDMEIEDCQTVCEFFGVGRGEYVWINGEQFLIDNKNIENQSICHSDPIVDSKALVGCLTGQLKWSKTKPSDDEKFGSCDSAWAAGRIVSVEIGGFKYKLTYDDSIFGLSERMINLGRWYVED